MYVLLARHLLSLARRTRDADLHARALRRCWLIAVLAILPAYWDTALHFDLTAGAAYSPIWILCAIAEGAAPLLAWSLIRGIARASQPATVGSSRPAD